MIIWPFFADSCSVSGLQTAMKTNHTCIFGVWYVPYSKLYGWEYKDQLKRGTIVFLCFFFWQALHSNRNGKNIAIFSEQFPIYCEFAMADLLNEINKFSNNRITERK